MCLARDLGEFRRGLRFDQSEKCRESGEKFRKCWQARLHNWSLVARCRLNTLVQILLEASYIDVEAENFCRKGMLGGKCFSPPDPLLPRSLGHRAIMGL